jgi:Ca2+-binding EF-hand superfamily protein
MTVRRRRFTLDATKFNAMSIAIISFASMHLSTAYAQLAAPSTAASSASNSAASNGDEARYLEAFGRADKDGDGKLSKIEAENLPAIAQRFDSIDVNKDGFISQAEYLTALKS